MAFRVSDFPKRVDKGGRFYRWCGAQNRLIRRALRIVQRGTDVGLLDFATLNNLATHKIHDYVNYEIKGVRYV
ncbi:hypothetical protein GGR01_002538 [Acetobacter oeni]|nr:hypothetical protein [Acetobacter oeni]